MRVVFVVQTFPKTSETFIASKFIGLLDRGADVHVACRKSHRSDWVAFEQLAGRRDARHRVHLEPAVRPLLVAALKAPFVLVWCALRRPGRTARYLLRGWRRLGITVLGRMYIDSTLIRLAPDIIHFEFGALATGRTYIGDLIGCKVVVSFRGYDLNFTGIEQCGFYDEVWEEADAFHFLGEDLWRRARARGCPGKVEKAIIPPAVDVKFWKPSKRRLSEEHITPERPLRLVSVGRLEWKKGYEYALCAVRGLLEAGIPVTHRVIGDGAFFEALSFTRAQAGLAEIVEFVGPLNRERVREILSDADVFLHAAVTEGFCNAVVEAQSMGLPVVCTDAGGLPENVDGGQTGFVVPRRDAAAMATKMEILARDPGLRRRLGEAGRKRVTQFFTLDRQLSAFESLYKEVGAG